MTFIARLRSSVMGWNFPAIRNILMLCLTIAVMGAFILVLVADGDEAKSVALIAILGLTSFCMVLSMILKNSFRKALKDSSNGQLVRVGEVIRQLFQPSYVTMIFFHSSAITMLMIFTTRLFATDHFGGSVLSLNFGQKVSSGEIKGDNYTMTPGFNTFAHFIQGFLSCLLSYPVIAGIIAKFCGVRKDSNFLFKAPNASVLLFLQLLSACCTLYPTYSMIKRFYKDAESFSRTSMMNNVGEWVLGYIVANGIGWLVSVLVEIKLLKEAGMNSPEGELKDSYVLENLKAEGGDGGSFSFGKSSEIHASQKTVSKTVTGLSTALLILLSVSTLLTGILIGNTWNYDDDDDEIVRTNTEVMAQFVAYYVLVLILMFVITMDS